MIKINIKEEVRELEESNQFYETKVTPFFDEDGSLTHKHIEIPALNKSYVRDNNLDWYLLEDNCTHCK